MSFFQKDNGIWYYTFYVGNRRYRNSTRTKSESKARKIESVAFAKAQELGPQAVTAKAPRLTDFGEKRFLPWVNETRGLNPKSRRYYKCGWELLKKTPIMNMPLDRITSEIIDRLALSGIDREKMSPSYRNQALRTLSRALHLAVEWKVINQAPHVHLETENECEELITPNREQAMGHGSARMMMRYQHPEYVEAVRRAINRRNESLNGFGPNSRGGRSSERLSALKSGADDRT